MSKAFLGTNLLSMGTQNGLTTLNYNNFRYFYWKKGPLKAMLGEGAKLESGACHTFFSATILRGEREIFCAEFASLEDAVLALSAKTIGWEFVDMAKENQNSGGCSTCQAH